MYGALDNLVLPFVNTLSKLKVETELTFLCACEGGGVEREEQCVCGAPLSPFHLKGSI